MSTWKYNQVSFISSWASRVFQVSRSPSRPTISLSREVLRSTRKKCEERWGGAFSRYGNWGSGGNPSRLEINKTLSFRDTSNKRDLIVNKVLKCTKNIHRFNYWCSYLIYLCSCSSLSFKNDTAWGLYQLRKVS